MKQLIILLAFIFASTYGFSQKKSDFGLADESAMGDKNGLFMKQKGDTIEIVNFKKIRFIKIGDNVYEIKSPTLEKVESSRPQIWAFPTDTTINFRIPADRYNLPTINANTK
jgi:hypothetical protein